MAEQRIRIEIGFDGGQTMLASVAPGAVERLEQALADGTEGAVALDTEDGTYTVSTRRIVYLKRFSRESRVGFGHG